MALVSLMLLLMLLMMMMMMMTNRHELFVVAIAMPPEPQ
jgi:hypothetical protein